MVNSISQANNAEKSPKISSVTPTATQFAVKYSFAIIDCLCNWLQSLWFWKRWGHTMTGFCVNPIRSPRSTLEKATVPLCFLFFVGRGLFIQWRIKSCRCYLHCPQSRIQIREENLLNTENEQITGRATARRWVLSSSMNTDTDSK